MAGSYHSRLDENVQAFIQSAYLPKYGIEPVSVHVDRLVQSLPASDIISVSLHAFDLLVSRMGEQEEFMPSLRIPLQNSDFLNTAIPSITSLQTDLSKTPPSLYLTHHNIFKYFWPVEDYRLPLRNFFNTRCEAYTYYRCFRNWRDFVNEDEYAREICIDYYPDKFNPAGFDLC